MCNYWDIEEARTKSATTLSVRMSDRNGLGPHKHVSGPKSYIQVEQEMEVKLGRPPAIGEVFIRTHTKKMGLLSIGKTQKVHEVYKTNKEDKLATLENDESSNGTSRRELSHEEDDELFLQSTFTNERGKFFGVGSLGSYINEKRKYPGSSSSFTSL
ncbi:unnamed protein product [Arabidopsis arenosa]|uniref:Uncharacterized protein n=1 Tax=Arabidopsis arenosa TaxID=38785 RepID=A0A8S1ZJG2_ARAAE|nr:unnamed protein product [Arabidopsis arenosa]